MQHMYYTSEVKIKIQLVIIYSIISEVMSNNRILPSINL